MKRLVVSIIALTLSCNFAFSQDLTKINTERINRTKKGMVVLGSWAAINLISSPILRNQATGSEKYFHEMNGYWNAVNLVIAGAGYFGLRKQKPASFTLSQTFEEQQKIEKLLLFNSGLDIGYVFAGLYLNQRGINNNDERLEGYGESLVLQGGFLAVFDLIFYLAQKKGSKDLYKILSTVSASPVGLRVNLRF